MSQRDRFDSHGKVFYSNVSHDIVAKENAILTREDFSYHIKKVEKILLFRMLNIISHIRYENIFIAELDIKRKNLYFDFFLYNQLE